MTKSTVPNKTVMLGILRTIRTPSPLGAESALRQHQSKQSRLSHEDKSFHRRINKSVHEKYFTRHTVSGDVPLYMPGPTSRSVTPSRVLSDLRSYRRVSFCLTFIPCEVNAHILPNTPFSVVDLTTNTIVAPARMRTPLMIETCVKLCFAATNAPFIGGPASAAKATTNIPMPMYVPMFLGSLGT